MTFTQYFLAFQDIPEPGKYGFLCSDSNFSFAFTNFICIILFFTITNIRSIYCNTCFIFKRFRTRRKNIIWFISITTPQLTPLSSSKWHVGITTSKSSALSIFTLLTFEMQLINRTLFFNTDALFLCALSGSVTIIFPFTTIYIYTYDF